MRHAGGQTEWRPGSVQCTELLRHYYFHELNVLLWPTFMLLSLASLPCLDMVKFPFPPPPPSPSSENEPLHSLLKTLPDGFSNVLAVTAPALGCTV